MTGQLVFLLTGLFLWLFITSLVSGLNIRFQSLHKAQISELLVLNFNIFRMLSPFCNLFFSWIVFLVKSGWGIVVIAIPPDLCVHHVLHCGLLQETWGSLTSLEAGNATYSLVRFYNLKHMCYNVFRPAISDLPSPDAPMEELRGRSTMVSCEKLIICCYTFFF